MRRNRPRKPFFPHRDDHHARKRYPLWQLFLMAVGGLTLVFLFLRYLIIPLLVYLQDVIPT